MTAIAEPSIRLQPGKLEPLPLPPLRPEPLVSVIIPNYNYSAFIGEAIQSALIQHYPRLEVVVCDDASTDDSCSVVEALAERDPRVRLVRHTVNQGHLAALGTGFAASLGQIICLLDSDDTFLPGKIEATVRRFQERPRAGFSLHRALVVDGTGTPVQVVPLIGAMQEGWLASYLLEHGGSWRDMATSALSFRREVGELAFPAPVTTLRSGGDCYCFTLMPMLTEVAAIDRPLNQWRIHGGNGYGTFDLSLDLIDSDLRIIENYWRDVNQRLTELGLPERRLDPGRNLYYHCRSFERQLLLGASRATLALSFLKLAPKIVKGDLAGTLGKAIRSLSYGVAIPLPMSLRRRWLNLVLGKSRARGQVATLIRRWSQLTALRRPELGGAGRPERA